MNKRISSRSWPCVWNGFRADHLIIIRFSVHVWDCNRLDYRVLDWTDDFHPCDEVMTTH